MKLLFILVRIIIFWRVDQRNLASWPKEFGDLTKIIWRVGKCNFGELVFWRVDQHPYIYIYIYRRCFCVVTYVLFQRFEIMAIQIFCRNNWKFYELLFVYETFVWVILWPMGVTNHRIWVALSLTYNLIEKSSLNSILIQILINFWGGVVLVLSIVFIGLGWESVCIRLSSLSLL